MPKSILFLGAILSFFLLNTKSVSAQSDSEIVALYIDSLHALEEKIQYQTGLVNLNEGIDLQIPKDYKFISKEGAKMIVTDIWHNPEDETIMGMIVGQEFSLTNFNAWAFVVSYDESGYVKDEDAKEIDYKELLKSIQEDEEEDNKQRVSKGYESMHLIDWAVTPFYDDKRKILHWAKKIQFGTEQLAEEDLTLNYDVRILGRKGVLSLNAVGAMAQLEDINLHIPDVLEIATFKNGHAYRDFDPSVDEVAAYTVGGLVAGKVLAKAGILALLLKNIKLVLFGAIALFGVFRKKIAGLFGRKSKEDNMAISADENSTDLVPPVEIEESSIKQAEESGREAT